MDQLTPIMINKATGNINECIAVNVSHQQGSG